eukprot:12895544-Prorocentrum_lima.AAC.1
MATPSVCRNVLAAPAMAPSFSCCFIRSTRAAISCFLGAAVTSVIWADCHRLAQRPPRQSRSLAPSVLVRLVVRAPFFPCPPRAPSVERRSLGKAAKSFHALSCSLTVVPPSKTKARTFCKASCMA